MGRTRSYTIYEKSDLEKSKVRKYYIINNKNQEKEIKPIFYQSNKFDLDDSFSDNDDEFLSLNSGYKIERRELTLKEKEEIEEKELENTIKELNEKYKNKELYLNDEISYDEFNLCKKSYLSNRSSNSTNDSSNYSEDENMRNLILYNVKNYSKLIKIMLIGENKVGKSYFLNKIFNNSNDCNYYPNDCLNIQKINTEINNIDVKLEFWDTNEQFLNSVLIKTYFKIANAFVIIVNENSDLKFIQKQIKAIQSVNKNEKIFFVFNYNLNNNINMKEIKDKFEFFCYDNYINFHIINLDEFSLENQEFNQFLGTLI